MDGPSKSKPNWMAVFIKVGGLLRGRFRVKSERSQGVEKKSGRLKDVDNQKVLKWIFFIFGLSTLTVYYQTVLKYRCKQHP